MIKVNLIYDPEFADGCRSLLQLRPLLADLSVELLDGATGAKTDTAIVHSHLLADLRARRDPRVAGPIVVQERTYVENVVDKNRTLIQEPNTIGWFKEHGFRDPALNNAPHVLNRYHMGYMRRDEAKYPAVPYGIRLTDADIEKIHLPFPVPSYEHFAPLRARHSSEPHRRNLDVFMFGAIASRNEIYQDHRFDACRAMARLPVFNRNLQIVMSVGRTVEWSTVCDLLLSAKIVVSHYGDSMSSFRDWHALYAGCILIKPDTSQQRNYLPDVFKDNAWYVPCASDFSDLEQKVDQVLQNYRHYYDRAQVARAALFEAMSLERRAADFYRLLTTVLGRMPERDVPNFPPIEPGSYRAVLKSAPLRGPNLFAPVAAFDDRSWTVVRASLAPEPGTAPGGLRGWKLIEDASAMSHDLRRSVAKRKAAEPFVFSFMVKAAERSRIRVWMLGGNHGDRAEIGVDLARGEIDETAAIGVGWTPLGSGLVGIADDWWWCWMAVRSDDSDRVGVLVMLDMPDCAGEYPGDGKSGAWFAGPRLEEGAVPTLMLPPG